MADETACLCVTFNQDQGCFAVGLENGFRVYHGEPLRERSATLFAGEGIGMVEMLFRCNYLALVGGGRVPKFSPNKVMIWDDCQKQAIIELEFRSVIKGVRLRRDKIVVALENKVYVYSFTQSPQCLHVFETCANPLGLVALCSDVNNALLAFPNRQMGHVQLVDLGDAQQSTIIPAHSGNLAYVTLNLEGTLLATTSDKGTLVRIFNAQTGNLVQEVRRGTDYAKISCINFDATSSFLCVASNKGTVHIFSIDGKKTGTKPPNAVSSLSFMKEVLPTYFSSEWSFAQLRLPPSVPSDVKVLCCFGQDPHSIIAITDSGQYFQAMFDPEEGGVCVADVTSDFLDLHVDPEAGEEASLGSKDEASLPPDLTAA